MTYAIYKVEPTLFDEGETATLVEWYGDDEHQRAYDLRDELEGAEEEDHTEYIVTHEAGDAAPRPTRRRGLGREWA